MADEYNSEFIFSDDYQKRLDQLAEAERRIAQNDATFKSIPTRISEVVKDKKGKAVDVVDYDVSQDARKAMAASQRDKMIENADTRAAIEKGTAIPPKYTRETGALFKLGVAEGDIGKLQQLAESGDVARFSAVAGKIGEAVYKARFGAVGSELGMTEEMRAKRDAMKGEFFGALGSMHDRVQQMARSAGRPTSSFGEMAIPQSEAGGLSLGNANAGSDAVAQSAGRDGTRAFTNIGTEGEGIQEIKLDAGLLRVVRKADGQSGYIPAERFDPARYDQMDMSVADAQQDPNFSTNAQVSAVQPRPSLIPPMNPAERMARMQTAAPMRLPSLPSLSSMFPLPQRDPRGMPSNMMPNPSFGSVYGF